MNYSNLGAAVMVSLARNFNADMRNLLVANGVSVPDKITVEALAMFMTTAAKSSLAYKKQLTVYLNNPEVLKVIYKDLSGTKSSNFYGFTGESNFFNFTEEANYFRMDGYMNAVGTPAANPFASIGLDSSTTTSTSTSPTPEATGAANGAPKGFWNNAFSLLNTGVNALLTLDTNKTNRTIAEASAQTGGAGFPSGGTIQFTQPETSKSNTTTYVVMAVLGVAVVGTAAYFVMRKKSA